MNKHACSLHWHDVGQGSVSSPRLASSPHGGVFQPSCYVQGHRRYFPLTPRTEDLSGDSTCYRFHRPSTILHNLWRVRCLPHLPHLSACELRSRETQQTLIASCLAAASLYGSPFRLATCSHVWPLTSNSDRDCSPFIMLTGSKDYCLLIITIIVDISTMVAIGKQSTTHD